MRVLVISNPRATATTQRERDVLAHALGSVAELEIEQTAHRGHAAALACRAMRDHVDVVVALGGDGTVNEVVNGLLTDGLHDKVPALGVVPAGSTNVFARALGLPNSAIEATGVLLDALRVGRRRSIGLGQADERWFIFAAGIGFDATVVAAVERERRRGHRSTHGLYTRVAVREFFASDRRRPLLHADLPDGRTIDGLFMAIITNVAPWTYLGGRPLNPTPRSSFDVGLDIYARRRMSTLSVLRALAQMERGKPRGRAVFTGHDLSAIVLRCDEPLAVQVDGDHLGPREKLLLRAVPHALNVLT